MDAHTFSKSVSGSSSAPPSGVSRGEYVTRAARPAIGRACPSYRLARQDEVPTSNASTATSVPLTSSRYSVKVARAPYGSWKSPISAAAIAAHEMPLGSPYIDDHAVYWLEGKPLEGGRVVIVRQTS